MLDVQYINGLSPQGYRGKLIIWLIRLKIDDLSSLKLFRSKELVQPFESYEYLKWRKSRLWKHGFLVLSIQSVINFDMSDQSMSNFAIILINICRFVKKYFQLIIIWFTKLPIILVKLAKSLPIFI